VTSAIWVNAKEADALVSEPRRRTVAEELTG
jgi:hypothetical protein